LDLAERFDLMVVEDACQAHGAQYFSRRQNCWLTAGSIGRAAAFSFYPGKNLGACGEAGAVTTNDDGVAAQIRMIRDHGQAKKYYHDVEGYNGRLDAIPVHLQKAYRHLDYEEGDFPACEKVAREIVSLPMFPQLRTEQQRKVVDAVAQFVERKVGSFAR